MDRPLINRVLVATDFSDCATHALDYAGFLAKAHAAPLDILHVTEALPDMDPAGPAADLYFTERRRTADGLLQQVVDRYAKRGVPAQCRQRLGIPSQQINQAASECGADLVVLGSHGKSELADLGLGSTAERVVRGAPCPVFTVRAKPEYWSSTGDQPRTPSPSVRHILAPVDFSDCSLEALDYATQLASQLHADMTILHVMEPVYYDLELGSGQIMEEPVKRKESEERLAALADKLASSGLDINTHVRGGVAPDAIVAAAYHIPTDLIVMGTHGRRGLSRFSSGSVAEAVLRQAPCPVVTLRGFSLAKKDRLVSFCVGEGD
jgi:nucleotide-binding universal stress UspA family protein